MYEMTGKFCAWLFSLVTIGFGKGLVLSSYWTWFVVPLFEVRTLTIYQALCLGACVQAWKGIEVPKDEQKHDGDWFIQRVGLLVGIYVAGWLLAWGM